MKQSSIEEDARVHASGLLWISNQSSKAELVGCPAAASADLPKAEQTWSRNCSSGEGGVDGTTSLLRPQEDGLVVRVGCWDPSLKAVLKDISVVPR